MASNERESALAAYEAVAPIYDELTRQNDYELWLAGLFPELHRLGLKGEGCLLDVACGSGNSLQPMLRRNWHVAGCDLSPAMIDLARSKLGEQVDLSVVDVRDLPVLGQFDLVWAVDDSLNYLLDDQDLVISLQRMRANLARDGLLAFDLNTLATYRRIFASEMKVIEGPERDISWIGLTAPDVALGSVCEAKIEGEGVAPHIHRQRHYPEEEVKAAISEAGLSCLAIYGIEEIGSEPDATPRRPLDEIRHTKAAYICGIPRSPLRKGRAEHQQGPPRES
jgi:SAM-dependent methyltransferase